MAATSDNDHAPLGPRQWPAWLGIGLAAVAARLPWPLQRALGRGLGHLLPLLLRTRHRVAARNLTLCFPELDEAQRSALLQQSFAALGIALFEFARPWWGGVAPMRKNLRVEGLEHLQAATASGRGVLLFGGHFTHSELAARLLAEASGQPVHVMVRRNNHRCLEDMFERARRRAFAGTIGRRTTRWRLRFHA